MSALVDLYGTTHQGMVTYVTKTYGLRDGGSVFTNPTLLRRSEIGQRLRLYRDDAYGDFCALIDQTYEAPANRKNRKALIPIASGQNLTRRITEEVASLYDKPALRKLKDPSADKEFHVEEKRIGLHELMQEANRLVFLCNEVLIWSYIGADDNQKLRIVTPDCFDAVPDPRDPLVEAGILLDVAPITTLTGAAKSRLPHYELWDDTYRYRLSAKGQMVDAQGNPATEPEAHGLGRIPGVLFHRRTPTDCILDSRHGRDIVSAHFGVTWLNIQLMHLGKSQGERQPYLQGNLAAVAAKQPMTGENPIALPPDVDLKMLESQTSPQHYLDQKRDVLASVAQTYGMSYEQLTLSDTTSTQSGKAYQVRREKLTELRNEQIQRAKVHEALVVALMGFNTDGMRIDHQEQAIPQDAVEEVQLLDLKMRLGLDSPKRYLQRKDTDLTDQDADGLMKANLADWAVLITMVRALNIPGLGDAFNPGNAPKINGSGKLVANIQPANLDDGEVEDTSKVGVDGQSPPGVNPGKKTAA